MQAPIRASTIPQVCPFVICWPSTKYEKAVCMAPLALKMERAMPAVPVAMLIKIQSKAKNPQILASWIIKNEETVSSNRP